MKEEITIGVFGGSGFYQFGEDITEIRMDTPYGLPSSQIFVSTIEGKKTAFLPRHGVQHIYPPQEINYRANVWAMKELGVKYLFGPCAVGSLQKNIKIGDIVFCDQFIDQTSGRKDTFYHGPVTTHISSAEPYCPELRKLAFKHADKMDISYHKNGTVVVIQGPRFSSKAESQWYTKEGWDVINMTQYPEVMLARELEMCYLNISIITDYDCGLADQVKHVPVPEIMSTFNKNIHKIKKLISEIIKDLNPEDTCSCHKALENARF